MTDSVQVFPPGFRIIDPTGTPYSGAYIEFFDSGTTTPKTVYSDSALTTALGSTVYTDSAGYPVNAYGSTTRVLVYVDTNDYTITVRTSAGVEIVSHDGVKGAPVSGSGSSSSSGITQAQADARYVRNPNALVAVTALDDTDILGIWDTGTSANVGITWANVKQNLKDENVVFATGNVVTMPFYLSAAPSGWTKVTTSALNDSIIRLTTGTGGSTGGTASFANVFKSWTLTQANLPSGVTLSGTTGAAGAHYHFEYVADASGSSTAVTSALPVSSFGSVGSNRDYQMQAKSGTPDVGRTGTEPDHDHSFSVSLGGSSTPLDFAAKHALLIICTKT